jgi:hypothetical protein
MVHAGMWTTPGDLMALAAAINAGAAPLMLTGHPVEPRMGLGAVPELRRRDHLVVPQRVGGRF